VATEQYFIDTSFVLALASRRDINHERAKLWSRYIRSRKLKSFTTRGILLEVGNSLSKLAFRASAVSILDAMERDDSLDIIPVTDELYARGFQLFSSRFDQEWGMVDCISCCVMNDRSTRSALSSDHHFLQMGFDALLLRNPDESIR